METTDNQTLHQKAIEAGEEPDQDAGNESGKNQFNYSERAAQTFNNPMRERGVVTEPPPMLSFRNTVAQWEIYDSYMAEYSAQVRRKSEHEQSWQQPALDAGLNIGIKRIRDILRLRLRYFADHSPIERSAHKALFLEPLYLHVLSSNLSLNYRRTVLRANVNLRGRWPNKRSRTRRRETKVRTSELLVVVAPLLFNVSRVSQRNVAIDVSARCCSAFRCTVAKSCRASVEVRGTAKFSWSV